MLPSAAICTKPLRWGTLVRSRTALPLPPPATSRVSALTNLASSSSRRRSRPASDTVPNERKTINVCYRSYLRPLSTTSTASTPSTTKPVVTEELYMRQLPSSCIDWNSTDGRRLFREALIQGTMECYYPLAAQFTTQADPAYCGLGTLTMVLNALNIDPGRIWKGPWRWYSESMLDCCISLSVVQQYGISLDTFACLARCNGAAATVVRIPSSSTSSPNSYTVQPFYSSSPSSFSFSSSLSSSPGGEEEEGLRKFRQTIIEATKTSAGSFLICAYNRQTLGQTGTGHYSPIGAYHQGTDSVLIMDVARFKYPPHWVKVSALYEAMRCIDKDTGLSRGYVTIQRSASVPLVLFAFGLVTNTGVPVHNHGNHSNHSIYTSPATVTTPKMETPSSCGHAGCSSSTSSTAIINTYVTSTATASSSTDRMNNCHGQGKSVPGAGETLRNAAVSFNETFLPIDLTVTKSLTPELWQKLCEQSIKIALDTFLHLPNPSSSGKTIPTSVVTNTLHNPLFPLHVLNDTEHSFVSTGTNPCPRSSHGTHCMTSLSKEQLSAAAALLTELEHTSLYVMVRQALEQYTIPKHPSSHHHHPSSPSPSSSSLPSASRSLSVNPTLTDSNSTSTHSAHSVLLSSNLDHAGDDKPIIDDIIPDNSSLKSTEIAGGTVMTLTNASSLTSSSPSSSTECGHKAMTCVRVHTAHVVTMLLLTLYSSSSSAVTKINHNQHRLLQENQPLPSSRITTAEILHRLVAQSLPQATVLVQGEVQLLRGQLELD